MFGITNGKGFSITFNNCYTVSVQFGLGNYCDNRYTGIEEDAIIPTCKNAEVAVFNQRDEMVTGMFVDDVIDVAGYLSADEVAEVIEKVRKYKG